MATAKKNTPSERIQYRELQNAMQTAYEHLATLIPELDAAIPHNENKEKVTSINEHQEAANFGPAPALFTILSIIPDYLPSVAPEPARLAEQPNEASPWIQGLISAMGMIEKLYPFSPFANPISSPSKPLDKQPVAIPLTPVDSFSLLHPSVPSPHPIELPRKSTGSLCSKPSIAPTQQMENPIPLENRPTAPLAMPFSSLGQTEGLDLQSFDTAVDTYIAPPLRKATPQPAVLLAVQTAETQIIQEGVTIPQSIPLNGQTCTIHVETISRERPETMPTAIPAQKESPTAIFAAQNGSSTSLSSVQDPKTRESAPLSPQAFSPSAMPHATTSSPSLSKPIAIAPSTTAISHPETTKATVSHLRLPAEIEPTKKAIAPSPASPPSSQLIRVHCSLPSIFKDARLAALLQTEQSLVQNLIQSEMMRQEQLKLEEEEQRDGVNSFVNAAPPPLVPIVIKPAILNHEIYLEINGKQVDIGSASNISDPQKLASLEQSLLSNLEKEFDPNSLWSEGDREKLLAEIQQCLSQLPPQKEPTFPNEPVVTGPVPLTI